MPCPCPGRRGQGPGWDHGCLQFRRNRDCRLSCFSEAPPGVSCSALVLERRGKAPAGHEGLDLPLPRRPHTQVSSPRISRIPRRATGLYLGQPFPPSLAGDGRSSALQLRSRPPSFPATRGSRFARPLSRRLPPLPGALQSPSRCMREKPIMHLCRDRHRLHPQPLACLVSELLSNHTSVTSKTQRENPSTFLACPSSFLLGSAPGGQGLAQLEGEGAAALRQLQPVHELRGGEASPLLIRRGLGAPAACVRGQRQVQRLRHLAGIPLRSWPQRPQRHLPQRELPRGPRGLGTLGSRVPLQAGAAVAGAVRGVDPDLPPCKEGGRQSPALEGSVGWGFSRRRLLPAPGCMCATCSSWGREV